MPEAVELRPVNSGGKAIRAPVVVDLHRVLVKTDLLLESVVALLRQAPRYFYALPFWLLRGKAYFKRQVALRVSLDVGTLPYRKDLLDSLKAQRALGRTIVLASGDDTQLAQQIASHLQLFDLVLTSDPRPESERGAGRIFKAQSRGPAVYLKALRPGHWVKNLLVLVPLLAAHGFEEFALLGRALLAFVAFGCFASSGYLMNDLLDLSEDRRHPRKRYRPVASGDVPLFYALWMIPALIGFGCLTGALVSPILVAAASVYFGLSVTYSLYLRKIALLDVVVLAGLYTLRIIAGSVAVAIWPSPWLLAFSIFLFFSLALVKRYSELGANHVKARGYEFGDQELLASMGIASGYVAILVLALYINTATAHILYRRYEALWLLCPLLLYWISHMWLSAHRGRMPDDPVVFTMSDRTSRVLILLMAAAAAFAL
jgi:4-hydroxybenzoate polyprenyltransferase